jgi:hypothetical protein
MAAEKIKIALHVSKLQMNTTERKKGMDELAKKMLHETIPKECGRKYPCMSLNGR